MKCLNCENELKISQKKFCSLSCAAKHRNKNQNWNEIWTEEKKKAASEKTKTINKGFLANPKLFGAKGGKKNLGTTRQPKRIELTCQECANTFLVFPYQHTRKFCSSACSRLNNYHPNSTKVHRKIYKDIQFDSGAEVAFAKLLDQHNIVWVKNKSTFFEFTSHDGKNCKYYPDFFLPKYNWWVEIKGKRFVRTDDDLRLAVVGNIERMYSTQLQLPAPYLAELTGIEPVSSIRQTDVITTIP